MGEDTVFYLGGNMYLEKINQPADVKQLNGEQLEVLAKELREVLLQSFSIITFPRKREKKPLL